MLQQDMGVEIAKQLARLPKNWEIKFRLIDGLLNMEINARGANYVLTHVGEWSAVEEMKKAVDMIVECKLEPIPEAPDDTY